MAVKQDPMLETVIGFLPEDGTEITHEEWRNRIITAGHFESLALTHTARRHGVAFRNRRNEDGSLTLLVSRQGA